MFLPLSGGGLEIQQPRFNRGTVAITFYVSHEKVSMCGMCQRVCVYVCAFMRYWCEHVMRRQKYMSMCVCMCNYDTLLKHNY